MSLRGELWLDGDHAVLATPYDEELLARIRAIPGRRWDSYDKHWRFELSPDRAQAVAGLVAWAGEGVTVDPAVRDELDSLVAERVPGEVHLEHVLIDRKPHVSLCDDWAADVLSALCGDDAVRELPELGRRTLLLTAESGERIVALVEKDRRVSATRALLERAQPRARTSEPEGPPPPSGVTWRTGGWPSPALVIVPPPGAALLIPYLRVIPGIRRHGHTWVAPAWPAVADGFARLLEAAPELPIDAAARVWLDEQLAWTGTVTVIGRGRSRFLALATEGGVVPASLREAAEPEGSWLLLPADADGVALLRELPEADLDPLAQHVVDTGKAPAGGALRVRRGELLLEPGWDRQLTHALLAVDGARREPREGPWHFASDALRVVVPLDPWSLDELEDALDGRDVAIDDAASARLAELSELRVRGREIAAASRAEDGEFSLPVLGGELRPFQRAGVSYALAQRRTFIADEQGLGKTIEALAVVEADDAFPAVVVCPASLKLNWQREIERWLPHRSVQLLAGSRPRPLAADIVVINYDVLDAHVAPLAAVRPRALVLDEAHYVKNPRARRTEAAQRLADALPEDALRLALTGTPVLNRPPELIAPLRIIGRLADVGGSGEGFKRRFAAPERRDRLHEALRSTCFLRRLKADVLPQLPAKRQSIVPVALTNEREYRRAEEDVIAWLRDQPGDLKEVHVRVARALRAEQLAKLNALRILAARGKLAAGLAWVEDFLASGEPLVVFARLREVQRALLERFPDAAHVLGTDSLAARNAAVHSFQDTDRHQLIVCSLEVAGQGITLTRASNACFLELDWTPAKHDQAEDRCHRIGQDDAVTAWYLLAADTIDEAMAEVLERKRATIGAVTDGRAADEESMVEAVVKALRERAPARHLRAA